MMNKTGARRVIDALVSIGLRWNRDTGSYYIEGGYIAADQLDPLLNLAHVVISDEGLEEEGENE